MDVHTRPASSGAPANAPEEGTGGAWRKALFDDTLCLVMVFDHDGRLLEANQRARAAFSLDDPVASHYRLHDLAPGPVAEERLGLVRRVISERRAIGVVGMMWGMLRHCTYRPLTDGRAGDAALAVSHRICSADEMPAPSDADPLCLRADHDDLGPLSRLTAREIEVLALIGHGYSTSEIAHRLYRSEKTVEWHRASLGQKLGVSNRVQLARIAISAGFTALPEPDMEVVKDEHGEIHVSPSRVRDEERV